MIPLKYATAGQVIPIGYALDTLDGNTEEVALTIANTDIKLHKANATVLANKNAGGATHISNGIYYLTLDATDTNTYGPLIVFVHVAGALTMKVKCNVMNAAAYDKLYSATGFNDLTAAQVNAEADTAISDAALATTAALAVVDANIDAILVDTGTALPAQVAALNNLSAEQVNAELLDVLQTDTFAELSAIPAATSSLKDKITFIFMLARNQLEQTLTTATLRADDATTAVGTSTVDDDGTTATRGEWV